MSTKSKKRKSQAPKEDVQTVNVGTSKNKEEIVPPFQREPSAVLMEGVEHTKVIPGMEVISETASIEEIKNNWSREHVILFLKLKKEKKELDIENQDIKIIENNREIVQDAVNKAVNEKSFEVISVSKLSWTKMNKIEKAIGLNTMRVSVEDFPDTSIIKCNGFKWDMEKDEDKQMQDVKNWFKNVLNLEEGYSIEDVHKSTKKEVTLDKARTILRSGFDIAIGPSRTECIYIETKKKLQELKAEEAQAKGELLIANADVALDVLVVLTDCNDRWTFFFITKSEEGSVEKYYIVTAYIDNREKALGLIKAFVIEQGIQFDKIMGTNKRSLEKEEINVRGPFSKKAKFIEDVEFCDERMLDMIPDMTDNELRRMFTRWRLRALEKSVPISEKPIIQQYISEYSDDYEKHVTSIYS
ncbi:14498_t:CDS:2 [Cetraspora pellucida]|uniref:14498_t:CDS:1 n=1 Tax=Cetraspora pellucida TaxID=1433469 RepID=A0A9N9DH00_9GLOM|nr:14498_t:CDS:2 [Cetraspora pellucida]